MSAERKHIDEYFKERLFDYEIDAPADVWNKIDNEIHTKKFRIIWRISIAFAASVAIILSLFTGYYFGMKHTTSAYLKTANSIKNIQGEKPINNSKTEIAIISNTKNIDKTYTSKEIQTNQQPNIITTSNIAMTSKTDIVNNISNSSKTEKSKIHDLHFAYLESKKPYLVNFEKSQKLSLSEEIILIALGIESNIENTEPNSETKERSWIIKGDASPIYSYRNILNNNSAIASNYFNSTEKPILAYSGGLNLGLELHRWRFESGIYYSNSGQNVDGVYGFVTTNNNNKPTTNLVSDKGIGTVYAVGSQNLTENNSNGYINPSGSKLSETMSYGQNRYYGNSNTFNNSTYQQATVEQRYKYVEIPVIAYYKLIDKKADLSVTGGLSTNILVGNDAVIKNSNNAFNLGPTKGVENLNYAGIIGFAFEIPVVGNLGFHFEPRIKYFLNSINTDNQISTHPYSIGVFSGVSYRF